MGLFLGIDMGTSYFKAALFDHEGRLKGLGRLPVPTTVPSEDERVVPVTAFWSVLKQCVAEAMKMAGCDPSDILALSYSSQANSFLLLDQHDQPLTPIILWTDARVSTLEDCLQEISSRKDFTEVSGIGSSLSTQMCVSKLMWFRKHQPLVWREVGKVMTLSDYLTFALTNQATSDLSTASLMGILDIQKGEWWTKALDLAGLDKSILCRPHRTGFLVGNLTSEGAGRIGLTTTAQFCLGGLDHHIAAIGAGLMMDNNISESTGTVLASVSYAKGYTPQKDTFSAPGLNDHYFFQLSYNENGAASLEWYQKNYAPKLTITELLERAGAVAPGSEGLVAKPFALRYADLEGFYNKGKQHEHGHYVRAILESTAVSLKEIIGLLINERGYQRVVSTGGGARSRLWVQIKADLLGKEFLIPECNESACLGAALLAATASGHFSSVDEASGEWIKLRDVVRPREVG